MKLHDLPRRFKLGHNYWRRYNLKLQARISPYFLLSFTVPKSFLVLLFVSIFTVRNPYSRNICELRYLDRILTECFSVRSVKVFILWSSPQHLHNWLFQILFQGFRHSLPCRSSGSYTPWVLSCKDDICSCVPLEQEIGFVSPFLAL